jgi:hypothetical protein
VVCSSSNSTLTLPVPPQRRAGSSKHERAQITLNKEDWREKWTTDAPVAVSATRTSRYLDGGFVKTQGPSQCTQREKYPAVTPGQSGERFGSGSL